MKCIYCHHDKTYLLNDQQRKCAKCKRKFSPKKLAKQAQIKEAFLQGLSATKAAKIHKMHYLTVQKQYMHFRKQLLLHADTLYQQHAQNVKEYDEYLYLPKSIKHFDNNMHKMRHFLTLSYETKVYTIMMPTIARYELQLKDEKEKKQLSKYLRFNKIAKLQKSQNTITEFWEFFENFIIRYKGISQENFIYYLKEAEWRFNYTQEEKEEILEYF
jgi:transposase-like protein